MNKNTAILIFANSAEKEAERKSFLSSDVFSALNKQTLKTVEKSGIEYFHFSEKNQVGNSFGERFSNAIETIFKKGFDNVITIGNDTPHLKTSHLIDTIHQLEKNQLVLGPSKDGGFYLMGIKKEHFNKQTFLNLPWQTRFLNSYIAKISSSKNSEIKFLESLNDLDSKEDIKKILHSFKAIPTSILKLLKTLFFIDKRVIFYQKNNFYNSFTSLYFNKGSPFVFSI
ncbi:DUF2064 domain-containing protein [uncultured Polaribacter sp.]|uniref:TIGR04282 family arsenosugar biosynthesis glycosyltransferase n=1 Tax=uncultured Polaribacter sp. TaxID=174711 RepID=UPI002626FEE3|nr:DUF2064 domain-containing protein [uncultured Polaribacter sp.]